MTDIRLSEEEIQALTPGLTLPRVQLRHLHKAGFWRARIGVDGRVILERAHYMAVCAGALPAGAVRGDTSEPQLQPIGRKAA